MNPQTATHEHTIGPTRALAASAIFVLMLLAALALWTAIPLGWIWIGSKVASTQFPSVGPYAVVIVGIVLTILVDAWLIGRLNRVYVGITGTNRIASMRPSWLKSMRDTGGASRSTSVVEAVMMGSVLLACLVFVAWFFLLAGSPIANQ